MSGEQKLFSFSDGLPTGPDVDLLMKTWPEAKIGDRFEYEAIEKLIGVASTSARFRTVTSRWRRRMLDRGLVIECEQGSAFFVADTSQIAGQSYGIFDGIRRKAKKQRHKLSTIRPQDEVERRMVEHHGMLMNAIEREAKKSRMNLLPDTSTKAAPQINPPREGTGNGT